jgi:nitroreductase/FMN reductase (NADPH)/FMN reductase [NAD(P)H]
MDADELRELFSIRTEKKSYEDYMKAFCDRKYNSEFALEMSRSVGEYLRQFEDRHK